MKKIALLMLLSLPALAENSLEQFRIVEQGGSGLSTPSAGLSCFHDADNSVSLCAYTNDTSITGIAPPNKTTDANAGNTTIHSENVWPGAAGARTAGNLALAGGLGSKTDVFDDANPLANCAGTTTTLNVNGTTNVLTFNTYCGAGCTTQALAATGLCAAIEALAGVGCTVAADTITLLITADQPGTTVLGFTAEAAACTTYSNGTDGCVKIGSTYIQSLASTVTSLGSSCGASDVPLYVASVTASGSITSIGGTVRSYIAGAPVGTLGFRLDDEKGAQSLATLNTVTATFTAGGTVDHTEAGAVPLGAVAHEVTGRVIVTADAGSCTTFDVGTAADPDLYANDVPIALDQTFGPTIASYGPTAQIPGTQITAAGDLVVTSAGGAGQCKNLSVRMTVHYRIDTPDTAI